MPRAHVAQFGVALLLIWIILLQVFSYSLTNASYLVLGFVGVNFIIILLMVDWPSFLEMLSPLYLDPLPPTPDERKKKHKGQVVMITGCNRGLGRGVAKLFLESGSDVIMAIRSGIPEAGDTLQKQVSSCTEAPGQVSMRQVDLSNINSVCTLAKELAVDNVKLDTLVLNAGMVDARGAKGEGGVSRMFLVNYFANVVLVNELLSQGVLDAKKGQDKKQNDDKKSTIIVVSSGCYMRGDPSMFGAYDSWGVLSASTYYSQTKYLLQVWTQRLAKKFKDQLQVQSYNPGPVYSDMGASEVPSVFWPTYKLMQWLFMLQPEEAGQNVLFLCENDFPTGSFLQIRQPCFPLKLAVDQNDTQQKVLQETQQVLNKLEYQGSGLDYVM